MHSLSDYAFHFSSLQVDIIAGKSLQSKDRVKGQFVSQKLKSATTADAETDSLLLIRNCDFDSSLPIPGEGNWSGTEWRLAEVFLSMVSLSVQVRCLLAFNFKPYFVKDSFKIDKCPEKNQIDANTLIFFMYSRCLWSEEVVSLYTLKLFYRP